MYYVICAAFIAMIGFYGAFQRLKRQPKRRKALTIACKCAATGMAVLVGVLGAARSGLPSNWVMTAGLIACMLADGLLCVRFMVGGAVFAVGHLLYIIAFCMMNRPGWGSLALFIALILGNFILDTGICLVLSKLVIDKVKVFRLLCGLN